MSQFVVNDPVYGFVSVPRGLLCELINHPAFQRLSRIRQLGMSALVYPGATHTRWAHSLGAYHLMREAFRALKEKGVFVFDVEEEGAEIAILLHDIGHGPFSHVLEHTLIEHLSHEEITRALMRRLNREFGGALGMAIQIYSDEYPKRFLHQLICSQLDTDRLDYLCRDSFYTGVREGNIGAARLIKMLSVADDRLVVEGKGLYSVENYLMARRLMYWQVYLHKTAVAAEEMLRAALERAKELTRGGVRLFASPQLEYFLRSEVQTSHFEEDEECINHFLNLNDSDILCALGVWQHSEDAVLSALAGGFVNRRLFKADIFEGNVSGEALDDCREQVAAQLHIPLEATRYFVRRRFVSKEMYSANAEGIKVQMPDGAIADVSDVSHIVRGEAVTKEEGRTYVFHPEWKQ
ncbi:MAG: HD domain-containing protein [Bacteroidales bacterium]|nr:HD domain-containing protein [Bacteroidales bacterium]